MRASALVPVAELYGTGAKTPHGFGLTALKEQSDVARISQPVQRFPERPVFQLGRRGESGWSGAWSTGGGPISAFSARFSDSLAQRAANMQVRRPSGGHLLQSPA